MLHRGDATGSVTAPSDWDKSSFGRLVAVIRSDWDANGADLGQPVGQMFAVHRLGEWLHAPSRSSLVRAVGRPFYRFANMYVRNVLGFEIAHTVRIGRGVRFFHQHGVVIQPHTQIGDGTHVYHGVTIGTRWVGEKPEAYRGAPRIGAGVQIGVHASILGAVSIGDGARVGAHALVYGDVPAGASVVVPRHRVLHLDRGAVE